MAGRASNNDYPEHSALNLQLNDGNVGPTLEIASVADPNVWQPDHDNWRPSLLRSTVEFMWYTPVTNNRQRAPIGLRSFVRTWHYPTLRDTGNRLEWPLTCIYRH